MEIGNCNKVGTEGASTPMASLWDFYAAHALAGILSRNLKPNLLGNNHIDHAHVGGPSQRQAIMEACEIADQMVKESTKRNLLKKPTGT